MDSQLGSPTLADIMTEFEKLIATPLANNNIIKFYKRNFDDS